MKIIATILSVIVIMATAFAKLDGKTFEPPSGAVINKQDNKISGLPSGAVIIEEESLGSKIHSDRALILWMVNPEKHPSEAQKNPEYEYNCIDQAAGSYYKATPNVSLINTKTRAVINTIEITVDENAPDFFAIPYAIRKGNDYRVRGDPTEREEAKPHIMWLKDYNGDGKAQEFALFARGGCYGVDTALIGYSERRDRVIHYPISIEFERVGEKSTMEGHWAGGLFYRKPISPGYWKYEHDLRGRLGDLNKYEIRYDAQKEMFVGVCVQIPGEPN
jgi:hypothetical protein